MKADRENNRPKRSILERELEQGKSPLTPEKIRVFRDRLRPGDAFWLKTDDGMRRYCVIEKYRHFALLEAEGRKRASVISMQYTQLMIAEREAEHGSRR